MRTRVQHFGIDVTKIINDPLNNLGFINKKVEVSDVVEVSTRIALSQNFKELFVIFGAQLSDRLATHIRVIKIASNNLHQVLLPVEL